MMFIAAAAGSAKPLVMAFHAPIYNASQHDWALYDWDSLDYVIVWRSILDRPDPDKFLIPYAHAHNAGVLIGGIDPAHDVLGNHTAEQEWIDSLLTILKAEDADGLNIDIEQSKPGQKDAVTHLTCSLYSQLKSALPDALLTFDLGVYPNDQQKSYDHKALSKCLDFITPMAYDMTGHHVGSNSPLPGITKCASQYKALGIAPSQLVIGLPWYGYAFPCSNDTLPGRGKPCALGHTPTHIGIWEQGYGQMLDLFDAAEQSGTGQRGVTHYWDKESSTPWAEFWNASSPDRIVQAWYDNPRSLSLKYKAAEAHGYGGVAIWTADGFHRSAGGAASRAAAAELWAGLRSFGASK